MSEAVAGFWSISFEEVADMELDEEEELSDRLLERDLTMRANWSAKVAASWPSGVWLLNWDMMNCFRLFSLMWSARDEMEEMDELVEELEAVRCSGSSGIW